MLENRKWVIIGFFCLIGLVYLARLFYLQVLDDTYSLGASKNSIKRVIEVPYRGQIYDRNNNLLVSNIPVYDLYVTPKQVRMTDTAAFCRLLDLSKSDFDSIMGIAVNYSTVKPSLFMRQLTKEHFARIQDALVDYRGFDPVISSVRSYPAHTMANALGYVSEISKEQIEKQDIMYYRQGDYIGHGGLEREYEEVLRGKRGVKFIMQNVRGINKGSWKNGAYDTMAIAGKNLITTIDTDLQKYADTLMQHKVGAVLAVVPQTGEILVSASAPTFDPNILTTKAFSKGYRELLKNPYKPLFNRPVMASYRPGSTFKLVQALIALQQGSLTPGTYYGHAGAPVRCHCRGGNDLRGAIRNSCNPYFYYVFRKFMYFNGETNAFKASAIGLKQWHDMADRFGMGDRLGVDLPSELHGNLPSPEYFDKAYHGERRWKFSNVYSLGIGEGELLISPLKLANLAATIANRGWYITPHFIKGLDKPGEGVPVEYTQKHETGIDYKNYLPVIDGMRGAVVHGTVDPMADIPGIDLCGKSGTSQNAKYGHSYDHSIFIGFAPMNDPKIAVAVFVENAGWGGKAAATVAALIAERYIKGKTMAHRLDARVKSEWFYPPQDGVLYKKSPRTDVPKKDKDTTRKATGVKPMMTLTRPKSQTIVPVSGN